MSGAVQALCNGRVSVGPSVCLSCRSPFDRRAIAFRSISDTSPQLRAGCQSTSAAAAGSVMLRAEVRGVVTPHPDGQTDGRTVDGPLHTEADLGMFSMFGRTGAPTKRGPTEGQNFVSSFFAMVVCIAARVLNKMSMMTSVRVGPDSVG